MREYTVLVIEDCPLLINSYKNILISQKQLYLKFFDVSSVSHTLRKEEINTLDIILLEISSHFCKKYGFKSGEDLGQYFLSINPHIKIIAITSYTDILRLLHILNNLNPKGLLVKKDTTETHLIQAINNVMADRSYYSTTVVKLLKSKMIRSSSLDSIDVHILSELSNCARMKELVKIIPLSKSGIEKRKRRLKNIFNIETDSDRDLVIKAKQKGFI